MAARTLLMALVLALASGACVDGKINDCCACLKVTGPDGSAATAADGSDNCLPSDGTDDNEPDGEFGSCIEVGALAGGSVTILVVDQACGTTACATECAAARDAGADFAGF